MKICLLTTSFPRNHQDDAGIFIARLAEALSEQSVTGCVIAPYHPLCKDNNNFCGWKLNWVKYGIFRAGDLAYGSGILPNLKAKPWRLLQIPALLAGFFSRTLKAAKDCQLIHANWLATAVPGLLAGKFLNKPVIVSVRGEDLKLLALPGLAYFLKLLLKRATAITTISPDFADKLKNYFPEHKITLIPNGITRIKSDARKNAELLNKFGLLKHKYAVYCGRLIALKRIELLLELLARQSSEELSLLMCGALDDQQYVLKLKTLAQKLNISKRVIFAGQVAPHEYLELLSSSGQYWSASEYEGRPNAVLEALAHGVPCVLSEIVAHSALIKHGENGFLFNSRNTEQAAEFADTIINDQNLSQRISDNAKLSVSHLSWMESAQAYINLFKLLAGQRPALLS